MKYHNFNLNDAEQALTLPKGWLAIIAILPAARRLSLFFANRTRTNPTQITVGAFIICLIGAGFFFVGSYWFLVAGAILFELNYLLDCVDGTVSRLTKRSSEIGAYLNIILDQWRIPFCLAGLAYGYYHLTGNFAVVAIAGYYMVVKTAYVFHDPVKHAMSSRFGRWVIESSIEYRENGLLGRFRSYLEKRKLRYFITSVETDTIVFFIGPVSGSILFCMIAGSLLLTLIYLWEVAQLTSHLNHNSVEEDLKKVLVDNKIADMAIFGTGVATRNFMSWCENLGVDSKIRFLLDNDTTRQNCHRFNRPVHKPEVLRNNKPDIVVITSRAGRWDITSQLENMGMTRNKDFVYANFTK